MKRKPLALLLLVFFSVLSGHLIWEYLRFPIHGAMSFLLGLGVFFLLRHPLSIRCTSLWAFSFLFALSLVLAKHIILGGSVTALSDTNYITAYSAKDLVALAVLVIVIYQGLARLLIWVGSFAYATLFKPNDDSVYGIILEKPTWLLIAALVFCWLPWLLLGIRDLFTVTRFLRLCKRKGFWALTTTTPFATHFGSRFGLLSGWQFTMSRSAFSFTAFRKWSLWPGPWFGAHAGCTVRALTPPGVF